MAKKLSVRIAERKKASRNGTNRAAFLAVRDDVKQALDDGWPVRTIWETLHEEGKIAFSYPALCRYVKRHIVARRSEMVGDVVALKKRKGSGKLEQAGVHSADQISTAGLPSFVFDSTPKKEDLI